jgi:ATP synthase protein I
MDQDHRKRDERAGDSFDQRLEAARRRAGVKQDDDPQGHQGSGQSSGPNPFSLAMRMGTEMVAALAIAVAIGYGLDRLFGTKPLLMIIFVPIGAAAGIANVIRSAGTSRQDQTGKE